MSVVVKNGNVFLLNCVWKSFFLYKKVWIFLKKMSLLQLHHVWDRCITERPALGRDRSWTWETANSQCLWHNSSSWSSPEAPVRIIFALWAAVGCLVALPGSTLVSEQWGPQRSLHHSSDVFTFLLVSQNYSVPMTNFQMVTWWNTVKAFWFLSSYLPLAFFYLQSYPSKETRDRLTDGGYFYTVHILTVE